MQQGFQKRKNLLDEKIYRVFIKYCVFSKILKYIQDSGLSRFPLVVSVYTSAAAELADFRKITTFWGKTQYLINTLYFSRFFFLPRVKTSSKLSSSIIGYMDAWSPIWILA